MHKRGSSSFSFIIISFQLLLLQLLTNYIDVFIDAGATSSSTPKNLVNLYTPNDSIHTDINNNSNNNNSNNLTSSNQFQNEYQYRQIGPKPPTTADRHKSSTSPLTDSIFEHLSNDLNNPSTLDYSYQDNRAMTNVPDCKGRLKLNGTRGYVTDGPGYYQTNLQCIWLIDSGRDNATIRIQFHQFNTECNYDFLYIFDGDSIYAPLVAALSGDMKDFSNAFVGADIQESISANQNNVPTNSTSTTEFSSTITTTSTTLLSTTTTIPSTSSNQVRKNPISFESRSFELKTNSGKAFIYFHSDTAQSMPGFYMTYSIDSCPLDCSNRGECDYTTLTCRCNEGYFGEGCQHVLCPNDCTSPIHGSCDRTKSCICNKEFTGLDCSRRNDQETWTLIEDTDKATPARAFHQMCIVDGIMWVFGGRSQVLSNTNMGVLKRKRTHNIFSFDLEKRKWTDIIFEGTTGEDHLAELSGHSIATHGHKVFIFGGMAMNNSVLNMLTVFDTKTKIPTSLANGKRSSRNHEEDFVAPLGVVGHSANIVDGIMYVFMGYNPLYGYLNFAQKFNIGNNSWSIVERRGSSISGCIGHTSTFDPIGRLIYIYGGHNLHKSNMFYSFDPQTEIWTYLQPGPSYRYYHSSVIIGNQLIIFGGNSYNTSHQSDQCFQQTYLTYDLSCSEQPMDNKLGRNLTSLSACRRICWHSIEEVGQGVLKRHGHAVVSYNDKELILYGGFNGVVMSDIRFMKIQSCSNFTNESDCRKLRIAVSCHWDNINNMCRETTSRGLSFQPPPPSSSTTHDDGIRTEQVDSEDCLGIDLKSLQTTCAARETCSDCLSTNLGCVWCGFISQCQYNKCKSSSKVILDADMCYKSSMDELISDSVISRNNSLASRLNGTQFALEQDNEMDCKTDNCYLCQSRAHCSWQNELCTYNPPTVAASIPSQGPTTFATGTEVDAIESPIVPRQSMTPANSTRIAQKLESYSRPFVTAFKNSFLNSSPYTSCDVPCYMRRSCNECTTTKCIWCSTTEQCVDSSAYFAYHAMGQCMHYVAHMLKCPVASCADIETCDKCLTNPKCGWINDISNTGKGKCTEGDSSGPFNLKAGSSLTGGLQLDQASNVTSASSLAPVGLTNWFYTSCPTCQCNGHSSCKLNTSLCSQPCQDYAEGPHCDRCLPGYFGDPINGGVCKPCRCNGHAQTCNRENGKCYCSVKGIIGHNCNRCDDKNYYIGDPSGSNGTCYYNLTTDYQYTFNMSKPEDHFYSEINFINVPLRKESDADFSIACSRLALVNITTGTSYRNRRPIHTALECGSFRLRFPHDRYNFSDANYSLFVHVYKFQTPFILQIAFSQQRTLYLPQFFFTFLSCFLFFFALSGLAWKLKHEYDLYVRRQRQFIEMEQMASRPFSTILLDISPDNQKETPVAANVTVTSNDNCKQTTRRTTGPEPTPISFEPCFGSNVGVLSVFVQLPGHPNLAIGSALVSLNDESAFACGDDETSEQTNNKNSGRLASKPGDQHTSTKNF